MTHNQPIRRGVHALMHVGIQLLVAPLRLLIISALLLVLGVLEVHQQLTQITRITHLIQRSA